MNRRLIAAGISILCCGASVFICDARAGRPATPRQNPIPPDGSSLQTGRRIYLAHCADCHGAGGKGDGKSAHDLEADVPDLTNPRIAKISDGQMFERISRGKKPMPGFERSLAEQERWHVINFVRTLGKSP
jgi:mono/diheme cytochrome c family protein